MPLDPKHIGKTFPPFTVEVEKGKIREFALALGDENPIFFDDSAAREAGLPGIVAPLTFATAMQNWSAGDSSGPITEMGGDYSRVVHGDQEYEYYRPVACGDVLTGQTRVADIAHKTGRSGPLDLVKFETVFKDAAGEPVLLSRSTVVIRS